MKKHFFILAIISFAYYSFAQAQTGDTLTLLKKVDSLLTLSESLWRQNRAAEALPIATQAMEWSMGIDEVRYAACIHRLGSINKRLFEYEKAEKQYAEAIMLRRKLLGTEHPDYANSLNNLGVLCVEKGMYYKAEPLFREVRDIRKKNRVTAKDSMEYAATTSNLAVVYIAKGDFNKAEQLFFEVRSIQEITVGKLHSNYVSTLVGLANLYQTVKKYNKSENLYREAITIQEQLTGKIHPLYASTLSNMSHLYMVWQKNEAAMTLLVEAKSIQEKMGMDQTAEYSSTLTNLAICYTNIGRFDQAEALFLQALSIHEKISAGSYIQALAWSNLAKVYRDKQNIPKAISCFLHANALHQALFRQSFNSASEKDALDIEKLFQNQGNELLIIARNAPTDSVRMALYDNVLLQKNTLLDAIATRKRTIIHADSTTQLIHDQWKASLYLLNKQFSLPVEFRNIQFIQSEQEKVAQYEKALAERIPFFSETGNAVTWKQVRDKLGPNEFAIEFVRYYDTQPSSSGDSIFYAALILGSTFSSPELVKLCGAKALDNKTGALQDITRSEVLDSYLQQIYSGAIPGKPSLYELLWKPIDQVLQKTRPVTIGKRKIFFSPDGKLHQISFNAISDEKGTYLDQRYDLVHLNTTRNLVVEAGNYPSSKSIWLFGDIQYDPNTTTINHHTDSSVNEPTTTGLRNGSWKDLPATKLEVDNIAERCLRHGFQVKKLTRREATEDVFKAIDTTSAISPLVLHLATHGFFYKALEKTDDTVKLPYGEKILRMNEDPMNRTGLVMAGANRFWLRKFGADNLPSTREDGILLSAEIKTMNFPNTQLAVLSACNSGLGDIIDSEGVFGLQRAFKITGVQYLIMSLWSVPDTATQQMMEAFYDNWLEKRLEIPAAFQAAQESMRKRYPSPFYWGGFVLLH